MQATHCRYDRSYNYLKQLEHWLSLPTGSEEEKQARESLSKVRDRLPEAQDCPVEGDLSFTGPTLPPTL